MDSRFEVTDQIKVGRFGKTFFFIGEKSIEIKMTAVSYTYKIRNTGERFQTSLKKQHFVDLT